MSDEKELIVCLGDMVNQHCLVTDTSGIYPKDGDGHPYYDSMALTANAEAIWLLIKLGYMVEIGEGYGRRVIARFTDKWDKL